MSNLIKPYGDRIKEERLQQSITQRMLADLANKEQSYISGIESGNIKCSTELFMEIMGAMGIRVVVSVDGDEIKTNDNFNLENND